VEDCRQDAQRTKAETGDSYLFISLKQALGAPWPAVLEKIGEARSTLLELRRVLNSTRHVIVPLRHIPSPLINQELSPYLRDVHDDLGNHRRRPRPAGRRPEYLLLWYLRRKDYLPVGTTSGSTNY
jgi:Mg2+ and Co2+ transporter CorA